MKRLAIMLTLILLAVPAIAGLKENRAIKDFQTNTFPELKKQIDATAGIDVPIEVDWNSLAVKGRSNLYNEGFTKVYFTPLINALKSICADEMGKTALKGALKKVVINNVSESSSPSKFSFKDGILTIDHRPDANFADSDIKRRADKIVKLIEEAL